MSHLAFAHFIIQSPLNLLFEVIVVFERLSINVLVCSFPHLFPKMYKRKETQTGNDKKRVKIVEPDNVDDEEDLAVKPNRGAIKNEGYESDEDVIDSDLESQSDDEQDMFQEPKKNLASKDIEGQEWNATDEAFEPFNMDKELEEGYVSVNVERLMCKECMLERRTNKMSMIRGSNQFQRMI
jgi:hypothetical protein